MHGTTSVECSINILKRQHILENIDEVMSFVSWLVSGIKFASMQTWEQLKCCWKANIESQLWCQQSNRYLRKVYVKNLCVQFQVYWKSEKDFLKTKVIEEKCTHNGLFGKVVLHIAQ